MQRDPGLWVRAASSPVPPEITDGKKGLSCTCSRAPLRHAFVKPVKASLCIPANNVVASDTPEGD